jgi:hypothetical protein
LADAADGILGAIHVRIRLAENMGSASMVILIVAVGVAAVQSSAGRRCSVGLVHYCLLNLSILFAAMDEGDPWIIDLEALVLVRVTVSGPWSWCCANPKSQTFDLGLSEDTCTRDKAIIMENPVLRYPQAV